MKVTHRAECDLVILCVHIEIAVQLFLGFFSVPDAAMHPSWGSAEIMDCHVSHTLCLFWCPDCILYVMLLCPSRLVICRLT